jgi:hypothetical protein
VKIDEPALEERPCGKWPEVPDGKRPEVAGDCRSDTDAGGVLTGRLGVGEAVPTGAVAAVEEDDVAMKIGGAVDYDR